MDESEIAWIPCEESPGYCTYPAPLTTFGTGQHGEDEQIPVPECGGVLIDAEIAPLVAILNRAGIQTVQSCQDVMGTGEDGVPRMGIIVVAWYTFPKLAAMLWEHETGGLYYIAGPEMNRSGWLCVAHANARYVSVIFPWRDLGWFTSRIKNESGE